MKFLWCTSHIMNSLQLNFHTLWTLYVGVMYFSYLYGWICVNFHNFFIDPVKVKFGECCSYARMMLGKI
jgi:hypothetical protein